VLDEEIGRLPAFCREAFILCYLEGKTNDQAARLLGWPKGTVATRLARARERLRGRLIRHGVTLSAAALSAMLAPDSLAAALPPSLVAPTAKAALGFAAGQAVTALSSQAATLAQGVIKTMFVSKLKLMAAVALAVAVLVSGTGTMLLSGAPSAADAFGETVAVDKTEPQYEAVMTAPPPATAEQALFFSASTNFLLGHYGQASRECARFVKSYPQSALADSAIELGRIATQLANRGEDDVSRQMAKAKAIINGALSGQPLATQTKQPALGGHLRDAELEHAEKDFRVAEFYRRTNHPGSAFFYYETVRRRYPGTEYAEKASKQLETLRETARQEKQPKATADAAAPPPIPRETWDEHVYAALRENHCWIPADVKYALWAGRLDGRRLMDVSFKRRADDGKYDLIARAKEAEIRVDATSNVLMIYLQDGEYRDPPGSGPTCYFEKKTL
jgi:outer membrane protein assembly factor BamD (BamD/ComL family)